MQGRSAASDGKAASLTDRFGEFRWTALGREPSKAVADRREKSLEAEIGQKRPADFPGQSGHRARPRMRYSTQCQAWT